MLDRLERFYSHAIATTHLHEKNRLILHSASNHKIILDKTKLSKQEINLLHALFKEEDTPFTPSNQHDLLLYGLLVEKQEADYTKITNIFSFPLRFIYFKIEGDIGERDEFTEALTGLFPSSKSLIWKSSTEGFLVQQLDVNFDDQLPVESIIDTITTDFFIKLSFYIGSSITTALDIKNRFEWEEKSFDIVKSTFPTKSYFSEQEIIIYLLLNDVPRPTMSFILEMLEPIMKDRPLLQSIKTYLECNMNTTLAAKKMYMHRNTMQYRVDKFIEKTSIDIKQFSNAVAVYLMLLSIDSTKKDK